MPNIYLSPSTQEYNEYVIGGNEEYYMNRIADAMIPYLRSNGIRFTRNTPQMTAASSIAQSNEGSYDLHVALHSNAAPEAIAGTRRGSEVYYYPASVWGKKAAQIMADNLKEIYPLPSLVKIVPSTTLGEVRLTKAPAILIEYAYHDNPEDAQWIAENINTIARTTVKALTQYFGVPFAEAQPPRKGTVTLSSGNLNIRAFPSVTARVLTRAPNGSTVTVLGQVNDWYVVDYNGTIGYAATRYIVI